MPAATLRDEILTEAYADLRLLVYQITHRFASRYLIPFDDLISEAHIQFVRACDSYDRRKGSALSSWVYIQVSTGLMTFLRKEIRHRMTHGTMEEVKVEVSVRPDRFLADLRGDLSSDGRALLSLLLSTPHDLEVLCRWNKAQSRRRHLSTLHEFLRDLGWTEKKIVRCFDEFRSVVNQLPRRLGNEEDDFWEETSHRRTSYEEIWLLEQIGLTPQQVWLLSRIGLTPRQVRVACSR